MAMLSRNFLHSFYIPGTSRLRIFTGTDGNILKKNSFSDAVCEEVSKEKHVLVKGNAKKSKSTTKKRLNTNVVEPALERERRQDIHSVVGIHLGPRSLYWAKVDRLRNILEWRSVDLFATADAGRKIQLPKLFAMLDGISESIPFSDIFVLETPQQAVLSSVSTPTVIANAIFRSQALAILLTILNLRLENEDASEEYYHKVFLLKQRTVSRFFNLLVGTERVSALGLVDLILGIKKSSNSGATPGLICEHRTKGDEPNNEDTTGKPSIIPVNASSSIIETYCALGPVERESMSQALLSALAFYDLVVFKEFEAPL